MKKVRSSFSATLAVPDSHGASSAQWLAPPEHLYALVPALFIGIIHLTRVPGPPTGVTRLGSPARLAWSLLMRLPAGPIEIRGLETTTKS